MCTVQEMAVDMMIEIVGVGQSARRLRSPERGRDLRQALRRHARRAGVRLRTAQTDDVVLAARLDAAIWKDSPAVMRMKLAPPPGTVELA